MSCRTPLDQPTEAPRLERVDLPSAFVDRGCQRTEGDLPTQADPPRPFAHVLSQPMAYNGETFVKCSCGLTFGNLHGVLPESCPAEFDDAVYAEAVSLADQRWMDARLRQRLAFHADAERLRRAMAAESRA